VSFRFKKASCIAVGTFNIYIFQPPWIDRIVPAPAGSEMTVESDLSRPGLKITSPAWPVTWEVRPDRLVLETTSEEADCGSIMDRVCETLPWTPLLAIGSNFAFEATLDELPTLGRPLEFPPATAPEECEFFRRAWNVAVKHADNVCTLQLMIHPDGVQLGANFQRELQNQGIEAVRRAAQSFAADRAEAGRLFEYYFGAVIEHGDRHD
jgi:hypothetical protein